MQERGCAVGIEQRAPTWGRLGEDAILDISYADPASGIRWWVDIAIVPPTSGAVRNRAAAARGAVAARRETRVNTSATPAATSQPL